MIDEIWKRREIDSPVSSFVFYIQKKEYVLAVTEQQKRSKTGLSIQLRRELK